MSFNSEPTQLLSCKGNTTVLCRSMDCVPCKRLRASMIAKTKSERSKPIYYCGDHKVPYPCPTCEAANQPLYEALANTPVERKYTVRPENCTHTRVEMHGIKICQDCGSGLWNGVWVKNDCWNETSSDGL